jgi:hypothetical protein
MAGMDRRESSRWGWGAEIPQAAQDGEFLSLNADEMTDDTVANLLFTMQVRTLPLSNP